MKSFRAGFLLFGLLFAAPVAAAQTTYAVAVQGPADLDETTRSTVENQLRSATAAAGFSLTDGNLVKQAASRVVIGRIDGEDNLRALGKAVRAQKVLVAVLEREGTEQWKMRVTVFDVTEEERKQGERVAPAAQVGAIARAVADEVLSGRGSALPPPTIPQPLTPATTPPPVTPGPGPATPPVGTNPVTPAIPGTPPVGTGTPPATGSPATPPAAAGDYKHSGFFVMGSTAFGIQPEFQWNVLVVQPGYSWEDWAFSLRLGGSVIVASDPVGAIGGFVLGAETRYYITTGQVKAYPVVTMGGILGSNSVFVMTAGFGVQYDYSKNLGFYGEIHPLGVLGGGGLGGNYHLNFGGGVQYRF